MSGKKVNWLITEQNITVNYGGETYIVKRTDGLAGNLIKAIKENDLDSIPDLVSAAKRIEKYSSGTFTVKDRLVYVNGVAAPEFLSRRIIDFSNEGLPVEPLVKFAENLQKNPSFRAVNELFLFLDKNNHPITSEGNFIAFKKVRSNFKDIHSGTFDNSVGNVVEMPRNQVNEDCNQTCAAGLHICAFSYLSHFGNSTSDVILEVEVSPEDVVSVPIDYDSAKMRVSKYKVLGIVTAPFEPGTLLQNTSPKNYDEEGDEICEYCECSKIDVCDCEICDLCSDLVEDCHCYCSDCGFPTDDCECDYED